MKMISIIILSVILISEINADALDNKNLLKQMKGVALPILRTIDPIYYIRTTTLISNGAFDAIAPYIETAKGVYSNITKRPVTERTTRNKNIAIAYACLRILNNILPAYANTWRNELTNIGLDPDDYTMDVATPIGIGNTAADNVLKARLNDGMNQNGDALGLNYNKRVYEDCIDYEPKNDEFTLDDPSSWQPRIESDTNGIFKAQVHICPHYSVVIPYAIKNLTIYECPTPTSSNISNHKEYKHQTDEILDSSYKLDDRTKMIAEYFNDKVISLDYPLDIIIDRYSLDLDLYVEIQFAAKIALFDGGIVVWKEKMRHNSVRPFSSVRHLYENTPLKAWGGKGVGAVNNIKGKEWKPYLRTPPHTEYPSATACFCSALIEIIRKYFNIEQLDLVIQHPKGSSIIESNITPSSNHTIIYHTLTEFVELCGLSRLYGGVHFMAAIKEGEKVCKNVADEAYEFVKNHSQ